jgi:hypothetical protein
LSFADGGCFFALMVLLLAGANNSKLRKKRIRLIF